MATVNYEILLSITKPWSFHKRRTCCSTINTAVRCMHSPIWAQVSQAVFTGATQHVILHSEREQLSVENQKWTEILHAAWLSTARATTALSHFVFLIYVWLCILKHLITSTFFSQPHTQLAEPHVAGTFDLRNWDLSIVGLCQYTGQESHHSVTHGTFQLPWPAFSWGDFSVFAWWLCLSTDMLFSQFIVAFKLIRFAFFFQFRICSEVDNDL